MSFATQTCAYDALGTNSPFVRSSCRACTLRSLAHGPLYHASMRQGRMTPAYVKALKASFGDGWEEAHAEVKAVYEKSGNGKVALL